MFIIPFVSFVILYSLREPPGLQSSTIAIILLIELIIIALKNVLKISIETFPYLAMPIMLFASIDEKLEFASNDMLLCFSMFAATLIVFSQKEIYNKWLFRSVIICGNMHLAMQVFGAIINNETVAIRSLFPLANEIMFFYMLLMFCSIFIFCKDNAFWKKYAAIIATLAFISLMVGDTIYEKTFEISGEDAVGIWLGLGCGILFTIALFLWKKFSLPKNLGMSLAALIFLTLMFASIIAVNLNFSSIEMREAISRLDNWQAAWNLIEEEPMGVGFGAYGANVMQHWPTLEESYYSHEQIVYTGAHNQYLQILTEIGWLGWLYYCALFAVPWFISIFRYLKTGKPHFLFIAGMLASMLSVMEVSEAISMFAFIQIIHWLFLLYSVKALLPLQTVQPRSFAITGLIRNLFFITLIPLLSFLFFDRGKQLYSMSLTSVLEYGYFSDRDELFLNVEPIGKALEIYPKNAVALWNLGKLHLKQENFEEALKAMDAIEEISGYLWPVNQARAEIYYEMGDMEKSCEAAKFPIAHFDGVWTLDLKEKLKCDSY
jgi:O-antigen ligase